MGLIVLFCSFARGIKDGVLGIFEPAKVDSKLGAFEFLDVAVLGFFVGGAGAAVGLFVSYSTMVGKRLAVSLLQGNPSISFPCWIPPGSNERFPPPPPCAVTSTTCGANEREQKAWKKMMIFLVGCILWFNVL